MSDVRYPVPAGRHRTEQVIERSRFVCTIDRVSTPEEAQALVRALNAEFPDASHNCWAYVVGPPGSTSRIGMSDAGEPHGTAGRPMLTVLLHSGLGDVAAVASRWFGGVKLGTGGLVKAYGGAVQHALESLPRAERVDYAELTVVLGYSSISAAQQLWPAHEAEVMEEEYGASVRYRVRVPAQRLPALRAALLDATRGQAEIAVPE